MLIQSSTEYNVPGCTDFAEAKQIRPSTKTNFILKSATEITLFPFSR